MTNLLESVKCFITGSKHGNITVNVDSVLGDRNQNMRIGRTYNRGYGVDTFIKCITLFHEGHEACNITPINHTEDSGRWKVSPINEDIPPFEVERGGTTKSKDAEDSRIDLGPDFDTLVKSALGGLDLGYEFKRGGGGGKLSDKNIAKVKELRALGMADKNIAGILSVKVESVVAVPVESN